MWLGLAAGYVAVAWWLKLDPGELWAGMAAMGEYAGRFARPDFSDGGRLLGRLGETVLMGVWGTVLAVVLAMPVTWLAAANLTPARWVRALAREALTFCRAVPDLLLALLLLSATGVGPLPGVLALGIHSSGFFGKTVADAMERLPAGVLEGVASTGASRFQCVRFAAWPSVSREIVGFGLYTLDRNVRTAMVLGVVGAGGIGVDLREAMGSFRFERAGAVLLLILVTVVAVDALSGWLRRRLD